MNLTNLIEQKKKEKAKKEKYEEMLKSVLERLESIEAKIK